MKLAFFPSSSNGGKDNSSKSKKSGKKKSRSLSRSDPPSFGSGSSSSSSEPSTTPTTVLARANTQPCPRPTIGRNASCLDAEYWSPKDVPTAVSDGSTAPSTVLSHPRSQFCPRPIIGRNASCLDAEYWSPKDVTAAVSELRLGEDGKLTREELEGALSRLGGVELNELPEILDAADQDGDGRISLEELLALLRPKQREVEEELADDEEEELRAAFAVYDVNGDGKISAEELHGVLRRLGDESCSVDDCKRMIRSVDSDGDGFVCFKDFSSMMAINGHR